MVSGARRLGLALALAAALAAVLGTTTGRTQVASLVWESTGLSREGVGATSPGGWETTSVDETQAAAERLGDRSGEMPAAVVCETPTPLPGTAAIGPRQGSATPDTATASAATYRLCGGGDPQVESSIAQLVAGRSFSASLVTQPDGCASLTVRVAPQSTASTGRQSTALTVSADNGRVVSVQIVSENGATQVTLGGR